MWALFMAPDFGLQRSQIVGENITLREIEAMWNAHNEALRGS